VVLEVASDEKCETGLTEEVELNWDLDQKQREKELDKLCGQIKHVFQRTARECKDIKFLTIDASSVVCSTEFDLVFSRILTMGQSCARNWA